MWNSSLYVNSIKMNADEECVVEAVKRSLEELVGVIV